PDAPNCGYQNLEAGDSYSCTSASHELTEDDFEEGEFSPSTSWEVRAGNYEGEVLGELEREGPSVDLTDSDDGDGEDGAGDDGSDGDGEDQDGDDQDGSDQDGSDQDSSDDSGSDDSNSGSDESASGTDATGEDAGQNADGDKEAPGSLPVTGTSLTALTVGA